MGSLKSIVPRAAGISSVAGAVMAGGQVVMFLLVGLLILIALTAIFGPERYRDSAQLVLMIRLGRKSKPQ